MKYCTECGEPETTTKPGCIETFPARHAFREREAPPVAASTVPTLFDRLYRDAPPYADETAAGILDAVNARGAIVYEHASDRALLLRGEGRCERLGQGRYPGRSLAAMVALGLLRVDAHHDPEGVGTLTFYAGTGVRVVKVGGSLASGEGASK